MEYHARGRADYQLGYSNQALFGCFGSFLCYHETSFARRHVRCGLCGSCVAGGNP